MKAYDILKQTSDVAELFLGTASYTKTGEDHSATFKNGLALEVQVTDQAVYWTIAKNDYMETNCFETNTKSSTPEIVLRILRHIGTVNRNN